MSRAGNIESKATKSIRDFQIEAEKIESVSKN